MTGDEIKIECESLYKANNKNAERLQELRDLCQHEDTYEGDYSYGIARTFPAVICNHCGAVVKQLDFFLSNNLPL